MTERARKAGAQLGRAELEQDVRPLLRVRSFGQRAFEYELATSAAPSPLARRAASRKVATTEARRPRWDVEKVGGDTFWPPAPPSTSSSAARS